MSSNTSTAAVVGWAVAAVFGFALIGQCSRPSPTTPAENSSASWPAKTQYVTARSLNCRAEPTTTAAASRGLIMNEAVQTSEERDGWVKVDGEPACWVMAEFLSETVPASGAIMPAAAAAAAISRSGAGGSAAGSSNYTQSTYRAANFSSSSAVSSSNSATASVKRKRKAKKRKSRRASFYTGSGCPCSGGTVCIGPRGGRYCITSGGNKRYGV